MLRTLLLFFHLILFCLLLTYCKPVSEHQSGESAVSTDSSLVEAWVTYGDQSALLERQNQPIHFQQDTSKATPVIMVDASQKFQQMEGFGASLTGSSAFVINQKLSSSQRKELLQELFTSQGINLSYIRMTIGASDFSLSNYTYHDIDTSLKDPELEKFSIEPDQEDVVPVLKDIFDLQPSIKLMGTPWSPPSWMKSSKNFIGGKLLPEAYDAYASYFVKYIQAFASEGITVDAVTIQNEPQFEARYPSLLMSAAEQAQFIKNHLGPAFSKNKINSKIVVYDHNWDTPQYPIEIMNDAEAKKYVAGSAFHCYAGKVEDMSKVHEAHPDKGLYFTECSGGEWAPVFGDNLKWSVGNLIIGATRNWSKNVLLWNLALDENHGPTNRGCMDCRGVVTVNSKTGDITRNVEYYILGHASKFIKPGAYRIASTEKTANALQHVVFLNPDGSRAMIVLNSGTTYQTFHVQEQGRSFPFSLKAGGVATLVWRGLKS
ncbi:hypothetical protein GXP67_02265 [Rhodocytophaga rosea]|uniref:Glucan endo-1,6-beta-glucosidase n=1 Tax=Rhodocytophaga rosea TaxID=2704465 RepID=A0A6C0GCG3_9BACT|nr:glycoside hydrolase family 30 beta sandwich domain-containing protein [Rhodocytophaga rosea]QHT65568.1 hypothetical protein GXP67_02265 [Rhodocytophaga rosea]